MLMELESRISCALCVVEKRHMGVSVLQPRVSPSSCSWRDMLTLAALGYIARLRNGRLWIPSTLKGNGRFVAAVSGLACLVCETQGRRPRACRMSSASSPLIDLPSFSVLQLLRSLCGQIRALVEGLRIPAAPVTAGSCNIPHELGPTLLIRNYEDKLARIQCRHALKKAATVPILKQKRGTDGGSPRPARSKSSRQVTWGTTECIAFDAGQPAALCRSRKRVTSSLFVLSDGFCQVAEEATGTE